MRDVLGKDREIDSELLSLVMAIPSRVPIVLCDRRETTGNGETAPVPLYLFLYTFLRVSVRSTERFNLARKELPLLKGDREEKGGGKFSLGNVRKLTVQMRMMT